MEPELGFCLTTDAVAIAYGVFGSGLPVLMAPGWVSHLEADLGLPASRRFIELLAGDRRRLILYDGRGTGLSDRDVPGVSLEYRVMDLEAVAGHLGLDSFFLLGWSQGGPPAIVYAARHPERVSRLILFGTFARPFGQGREEVDRAVLALMRAEWSIGCKTVVQFMDPDASREDAEASARFFRLAANADVATAILEEGMFHIDVTEYLPSLTMPALVMHRTDDQAVPFRFGRELAALIPNARFVPLAGRGHPPFLGDTHAVLAAIDQFLAPAEKAEVRQPAAVEVGGGLRTILFTDMEGSTTLTQRQGDAQAQEVLRSHNAIVREALRSHGGSEVKHTGDGIMASFPSASRALECAVAIQDAFSKHSEAHPDSPIRVRIGLNAGEPVAEDRDLYGAAVQLAARVCAQARPGQILVSNVVRELTMGKGFLFAHQGDVLLRGFEDPVRLYEVPW